MNRFVPMVGALLLLAVSYGNVMAHGEEEPFLRVNGSPTKTNLVAEYNSYPDEFPLAKDVAPEESYLVNTPITFTVLEEAFPFHEIRDPNNSGNTIPAVYHWSFPDGMTQDGTEVVYTFTESGTHVVTMSVSYPPVRPEKNEAESIQITLVPDGTYKLPKAIITVNDQTVTDTENEVLTVAPNAQIRFDASKSQGEGLRYQWIFGDGETSLEQTTKHIYKDEYYLLYPILRVSDKNGISSDTFVQLEFKPEENKNLFLRLIDWFVDLFQQK